MDEKQEKKQGFNRFLGITFLIGFGFFTMGLMDPLYDTYIPMFLRRYIDSNTLIGGIMTLDNILQLGLIPFIAIWSDRTRTRIGRRMPFIIVMLPIAAVLFRLIPSLAAISLAALIGIIFFFNIFKTAVRGPVVALMPDSVPGNYRSEANGVINTMGGIGLIVSTLVLARFMDISQTLPFLIAAVCIVLATLILFIFVKERPPAEDEKPEEREPVWVSLKRVFLNRENSPGKGRDATVPRILFSLFFWFMAYEGVKPFLGLYLVESLGVSQGNAALAQGIAGISSVMLAIPTGYWAHRFGRRNFIRLSLTGLALILFLIPLSGFFTMKLGLDLFYQLLFFFFLMFLYGAVWIGVVVNSFPMLWQMADYGNMGIYTGLYYTFSQSAAILAPPITGAVIDLGGYPGIFVFGGICMLAAWFIMGGVSAGEPTSGRPG
ncbi:MAG: MFS transporter [Treponema sp.]|jgi:MFS family permease|nr:MFS transporter [Treponema sp.]